MSTFFMLGNYSSKAIKGISAKRTEQGNSIIEKYGGKVKSIYTLLGGFDLVIIADFPGIDEAMKASISLTRLTDISFSTYHAMPVEHFDEIIAEL